MTEEKIHKAIKVYGVLAAALAVLVIPLLVLAILNILRTLADPEFGSMVSKQTLVLTALFIVALVAQAVQSIVLAVRFLRNKRRAAAAQIYAIMAVEILSMVLLAMINGVSAWHFISFVHLIFLIVMATHLDPALRQERALQRRLKAMDERSDKEEGVLGRDKSGKGYISLNFFNLFWIFVVACLLGDLIETVYVGVLDHVLMNRTGVLWGPFSPIYGVGATLMTVALNRFYKKNPVIIYVGSALIGGAFEYLVSWFFQFAFGITAWDYSDAFMNIGGRTDLTHMLMWGLLGIFWVKVCLPWMLRLINRIPWNLRYAVTTVCAAFMIVNCTMTMLSFDCWYQRMANQPAETAVAEFFADHYDDEFMAHHFQTMDMDPSAATRS